MPGAVYLYQGEELGLPEVLDLPDELRQDPIFARTGGARLGRDGCRIPMPWTVATAGAHGFSASGEASAPPWLPIPHDWGRYAAEAQHGDDSSVLELYRRLGAARRRLLDTNDAALLEGADELVVLRRGSVVIVLNTGREPVDAAAAAGSTAVLTTGTELVTGTVVPPDTTVWFAR